MLGDDYGSILGDVAGSLFAAGLNDKAAEATKVNVFSVCERFLDNFHELLKGSEDGSLLDAGGFSDFVDDFGFSHC